MDILLKKIIKIKILYLLYIMPPPSNGSTIDITASFTIGPGAFSPNGKSYTIKPTSAPITVTLVGPINITFPSQCIYIAGNGNEEILITGSAPSTKINVTCNNYPGLVNNGGPAATNYGVNNVTIQNLSISFSTSSFSLQQQSGFICQAYFGNKNGPAFSNLRIKNCISSGGNISSGSGGIVGADSNCTVTDCSSLCGLAGTNAGGIFGYKCGGKAINCTFKGTMTIGSCGGIFGAKSSGIAESCTYILGTKNNSITSDSGGIFGPNASNSASAKNCTNNAILNGPFSGGIFGKNGAGSAENCTNNGAIVGTNSGGIFGANSSGTAISCTNKGEIIGGQAAGIVGSLATPKTIINNCKNGVNGTKVIITGAGGSGGLLGPQAISGVSIINSINYYNIGAANSGGIAGIGVKKNTLKVGSTYTAIGVPVSFKGVNGKTITSPAGKNFKEFTI